MSNVRDRVPWSRPRGRGCLFVLLLVFLLPPQEGGALAWAPSSRSLSTPHGRKPKQRCVGLCLSSSLETENVAAAVVVPGFLTGADEFESLCRSLSSGGHRDGGHHRPIPTVVVPMPNWHWLPCLGGRSARPILERIDFTVRHVIDCLERQQQQQQQQQPQTNNGNLIDDDDEMPLTIQIPSYQYTWWDLWQDFRDNPGGVRKVGGSSKVDEYPEVEPRGNFPLPTETETKTKQYKIALIGHSAGGWISRVYLSDRSYGGRAYHGSRYVHTLVTLGTPHADADGPAFEGLAWINANDNDNDNNDNNNNNDETVRSVNLLSVAGSGFRGDAWGGLTQGAYRFCCGTDTNRDPDRLDGDGVTPVFSALAMPFSQKLVLPNVTHFCWSDVWGGSLVAPELTEDHRNGRSWYGSDDVVDQWAEFIQQSCNSDGAATLSSAGDSEGEPVESTNG